QTTKTNGGGELIATLDSSVPLNGVKVSLAIENHAAVIADPVSIKSENIDVTCKANGESPVLVDEDYTCTAKVTDAVGNKISGKTVKWMVKDNSELKPVPDSGETNGFGEVTTTLTSHTAVSNIIVMASVDGQPNGESKEQINFAWPEITIDTLPKDHNVTVGGQEKYSLTATVWRKKNEALYKGQNIKFKWAKPQLSNGTDAPDVTLSPLPDTSQLVNPTDGTLKANLVSSKAQQVKACLDIDGRKPASPICSALMHFVDPPIEFEISSVEVTNFDKDKPLLGNGASEYIYKAMIVAKDTKKTIPNHMFSGVVWAHDHDKIEEKKFPQPEAYSPTNGDKFTTDGKGYLYARLKSNVGVKNVKVTLKMPEPDGAIVKLDADKQVSFKPIALPAVLYVYNTNRTESKYFDNTNGKRHPHTIFYNLYGELRASRNSGSFNKDEIIYKAIDIDSTTYKDQMLSFGPENRGPIEFQAPGSATITATISKESGEIQLYEYKMSAVKMAELSSSSHGYKNITDDIECKNSESVKNVYDDLFSDEEVSNSSDIYSVYNEFGNLYNWGVFSSVPGIDKNKMTFIVKNTMLDNGKKFRVYDSKNNTFDDYSEGIVLCYLAYKK
ncbi:Ig-like domain-containing protein, partial [Xenorhabdus santafensis]|uniref:Ig-like domain-containing protein n=1 Tax=Xenorhabdus santafensis TaxID=2582833 RepID=UPI0029E80AF3